ALRRRIRAEPGWRDSAGAGGGRRELVRIPGEIARAGGSVEARRGRDEVDARPARRAEAGRAVREVGRLVAGRGEDRRGRARAVVRRRTGARGVPGGRLLGMELGGGVVKDTEARDGRLGAPLGDEPAGDAWQQGGALVVQPGGKVTFRYVSLGPGDHPGPTTLLAALKRAA